MSILNQLKAWRARFEPAPQDDYEDVLNRTFAGVFGDAEGKRALDYLIATYYQPIQFVGAGDGIKLGERNGQQLMMVDILTRVDMGMHPMLYREAPSSEDDKPLDVRQ